jgi:hypothetical protein
MQVFGHGRLPVDVICNQKLAGRPVWGNPRVSLRSTHPVRYKDRMSRRRTVLLNLAAAVALAAALAVALGATGFVGMFGFWIVRAMFPSTISWNEKDAYAKCESAIANADWPKAPANACAAMHMCSNEAVLSEPQTNALYAAIRRTEGCQEP